MIEAIRIDRGVSKARAVCDDCGKDEVVAADVDTVRGVSHVNEGQVTHKLSHQGWALVKGKLRCPMCEAKRKTTQPKKQGADEMTAIKTEAKADIRQPSARMVAQIVGLLEDAYDDKQKRYRNPADSDKSIAEVIGGGCMWGWVADIREREFGPDTRNQEVDAIRADLKKVEGQLGAALGEVRKVEGQLGDLRARLEKVAK